MRRVHRHRRQQGFHRLDVIIFNVQPRRRTQLLPAHHANRFRRECRQQFLAPAIVLRLHEAVNSVRQLFQHFPWPEPIRPRLAIPMLHQLQHAGHAHLDELIQIARGDRQKFHPLQQRILLVTRLFQHSLVELHPRVVPVENVLWVRYIVVFHDVLAAKNHIAIVLQPCYQRPGIRVINSIPVSLGPANQTRYALGPTFPVSC